MLRPCVDATIAAVTLYKDDDLKEVDATLSSDLKDYDIHTSDATKDNFRKADSREVSYCLGFTVDMQTDYQMWSNWRLFQ